MGLPSPLRAFGRFTNNILTSFRLSDDLREKHDRLWWVQEGDKSSWIRERLC